MLEFGADKNACDLERATPLWYGCEYGHRKVVTALLSRWADPNLADKDSIAPLYAAAERGYATIVEELLEYGADSAQVCSEFAEVSW